MSLKSWMLDNARDPVSGFTHLAGAFLGFIGLGYLLSETMPTGDTRAIAASAIFGTSLILLYLSSAAYHLLKVSDEARLILRRIDHALIFSLIAGTYTPFCLLTLRNAGGAWVLAMIWGIAVAGFFLSIFWIHAPRWLSTGLYLFMGWFVVVAFRDLRRELDPRALAWLIAGGLAYTLGAIIYAIRRPNPFPPHFGFHEIWHLFVLVGSACHFVSVVFVFH